MLSYEVVLPLSELLANCETEEEETVVRAVAYRALGKRLSVNYRRAKKVTIPKWEYKGGETNE